MKPLFLFLAIVLIGDRATAQVKKDTSSRKKTMYNSSTYPSVKTGTATSGGLYTNVPATTVHNDSALTPHDSAWVAEYLKAHPEKNPYKR